MTPKRSSDVMALLGRIGTYMRGQQFAWRGMPSADFNVMSSLHRHLGFFASENDVRAAELEILRRAREWGLGITESGHVDDLQLLADLQHYGIPTRLLDFTSNPMTALWFACQSAPERPDRYPRLSNSGVLLALNITSWKRHSSVGDANGTTFGELEHGRGWTLVQALESGEPFVVRQAVANARLRAQEGFFVASAVPEPSPGPWRIVTEPFVSLDLKFKRGDPAELEARLTSERPRGKPKPMPFVAIIIGAGLKAKLLSYLEGSYNRHPGALFPDYEGFRQYGTPDLSEVPPRRKWGDYEYNAEDG